MKNKINNTKLRKGNFVFPVAIALIALCVIGFLGYIIDNTKVKKSTTSLNNDKLNTYLENQLNEQYLLAHTTILNVAQDINIVESLIEQDTSLAQKEFNLLASEYTQNAHYDNVKFHIHTSDIKSFLRSWNNKRGDDLSSFRHTIQEVKKTRTSFATIEIGRAGMVMRGLAPIMYDGKYIGSIELLKDIDAIVYEAKKRLKN